MLVRLAMKDRVSGTAIALMSVGRAAPTRRRATVLATFRQIQGIVVDLPTMKVVPRLVPLRLIRICQWVPPLLVCLPQRPYALLPLVARNAWRSPAIVLP
jgi:hypothetical protein